MTDKAKLFCHNCKSVTLHELFYKKGNVVHTLCTCGHKAIIHAEILKNRIIMEDKMNTKSSLKVKKPIPLNVKLAKYIDSITDDDVIAIDNTAESLVYDCHIIFDKLLDLLVLNAYNAYVASLVGSASSRKRFVFHSANDMQDLKEGDLVMEISTISNKQDNIDRIGIVRTVWGYGHITIETLDGRKFTWDNAKFIRIHAEKFKETNFFEERNKHVSE